MDDFIKKVLRVHDKRETRIFNSLGVYDAYKYIRKNKWEGIGKQLTEGDFYKIIRSVNQRLAEELNQGRDIVLPHRMGRLEVRKKKAILKIKNGKLITNLKINWKATLDLWKEDAESYKNKTLVRHEGTDIFSVKYFTRTAKYKNKSFYEFIVNRKLRVGVTKRAANGEIDALSLY